MQRTTLFLLLFIFAAAIVPQTALAQQQQTTTSVSDLIRQLHRADKPLFESSDFRDLQDIRDSLVEKQAFIAEHSSVGNETLGKFHVSGQWAETTILVDGDSKSISLACPEPDMIPITAQYMTALHVSIIGSVAVLGSHNQLLNGSNGWYLVVHNDNNVGLAEAVFASVWCIK
jgi:hypothetical protein